MQMLIVIAIGIAGPPFGALISYRSFKKLYKARQDLDHKQIDHLRTMVREYLHAYKHQLEITERVFDDHCQTMRDWKEHLNFSAQKTDEWHILHTLCDVLERNGTKFEPDSVLNDWWRANKGIPNDEDQRR